MKIGVDVGGTNTDAVVLGPGGVLGWKKTATTPDVYSGIVTAIRAAKEIAGTTPDEIDCVMIGTTQFTNAVIERRSLLPVGIVRLALPAASAIPPLTDWPSDLVETIGSHVHQVRGGYEYDGREIAPLDERAVAEAARSLKHAGIVSTAVTSVFAPINGMMERRAAEIIRDECPDMAVSLSGELGQFGLLPRENSTIINASLVVLARRVVDGFRRALVELGLNVPLFISAERRHPHAGRHCRAIPGSDLRIRTHQFNARCGASGANRQCDGGRYRRNHLGYRNAAQRFSAPVHPLRRCRRRKDQFSDAGCAGCRVRRRLDRARRWGSSGSGFGRI